MASMTPPVCQIVWKDSYSIEDLWHPTSDYTSEPRVIITAGFLVHEDDEYITVATTYDPDSETFGNGIAVLKACVLSRKTYTA